MEISDVISLITSVVSVGLGLLALWQARRYKKLADSAAADQDEILREIREMSTYLAVMVRSLEQRTSGNPQDLITHKDELYIWKTCKYSAGRLSELSIKFEKELPPILKDTYITSTIAHFIKDDEFKKSVYLRGTTCNDKSAAPGAATPGTAKRVVSFARLLPFYSIIEMEGNQLWQPYKSKASAIKSPSPRAITTPASASDSI